MTFAFFMPGKVRPRDALFYTVFQPVGATAASLVFSLFEVQASAFSLNPVRSLVPAVPSGHWDGGWILLLAPPAGMLLAAFVNRRVIPLPPVLCAKLMHDGSTR